MTSQYLIRKDKNVTRGVSLHLLNTGAVIEFQFPPVISNDSRRVAWNEVNVPGRDPIAVYTGNSSRELTMELTYIVETIKTNATNGDWTIDKIKKNINELKGYFTGASVGLRGTLMAEFKHTLITGNSLMSMRIGGVSVRYEGPPIGDSSTYLSHPLKTVVVLDLATVTSSEVTGNVQTWWAGIHKFPTPSELWY